jgi:Holliday junction resolvase RusA-like endonuclease
LKFKTKITVQGKPDLPNKSHSHWSVEEKRRKLWHGKMARAIHYRPNKPLSKVKMICTRYSSRKPDYDNLVYSFKAVVDSLVKESIIVDDDLFTIVERHYFWVKTKEVDSFITVEVIEL